MADIPPLPTADTSYLAFAVRPCLVSFIVSTLPRPHPQLPTALQSPLTSNRYRAPVYKSPFNAETESTDPIFV
ncbi:hypothetical protein SprV_0501966300 [Sparganum proliferum]